MRLLLWTFCLSWLAGCIWLSIVMSLLSICSPNVPAWVGCVMSIAGYASSRCFWEVAEHAPSTWSRSV